MGRTGGVEGDGDANPPRRFSPRGAPWLGLPRAGCPLLPFLLPLRRPTGLPTAGPRRRCSPGRRPPPRSSVEGRCSARLLQVPAACPSKSCNQGPGVHAFNTCSTTGDPSGPPSEGRALLRSFGAPRYPTVAPRPCRASQCRSSPTGSGAD